ncbi:penicillin-binding protein activator, partial [Desertibaculum subflavum]|uniref:penicillin-binding protein activator n=1 Tax=Desertibaculum subflavum TaxID=2268458 RepID=UPI0013C403E9
PPSTAELLAPGLTPPALGGPARVALLLPLSGPQAAIGRMMLDAAHLALVETGSQDIVLLPRDTESRPERAAEAAREAMAAGAGIVLGPLLAAEVRAVGEATRPSGIPVIGFSTDRSVAGNGVYLIGFTPEEQITQVVRFAAGREITQFAALAPETPYGEATLAAYRQAIADAGATLVQVETFAPGTPDLTPVVKRLADYDRRHAELQRVKRELAARADEEAQRELRRIARADTYGELSYQAVLLPEGGQALRNLAPLLPYYDIDPANVRFLGTGLWDEPGLGKEPALIGGWFAGVPPELADAFVRRFDQAFGRRPPRIASLAYDAVALAAVLAKSRRADAFSVTALESPDGFAGFNGIFRLTPGGVAERGLAILEVTAGGFRVVRPAPQSFQAIGQ